MQSHRIQFFFESENNDILQCKEMFFQYLQNHAEKIKHFQNFVQFVM